MDRIIVGYLCGVCWAGSFLWLRCGLYRPYTGKRFSMFVGLTAGLVAAVNLGILVRSDLPTVIVRLALAPPLTALMVVLPIRWMRIRRRQLAETAKLTAQIRTLRERISD